MFITRCQIKAFWFIWKSHPVMFPALSLQLAAGWWICQQTLAPCARWLPGPWPSWICTIQVAGPDLKPRVFYTPSFWPRSWRVFSIPPHALPRQQSNSPHAIAQMMSTDNQCLNEGVQQNENASHMHCLIFSSGHIIQENETGKMISLNFKNLTHCIQNIGILTCKQ